MPIVTAIPSQIFLKITRLGEDLGESGEMGLRKEDLEYRGSHMGTPGYPDPWCFSTFFTSCHIQRTVIFTQHPGVSKQGCSRWRCFV